MLSYCAVLNSLGQRSRLHDVTKLMNCNSSISSSSDGYGSSGIGSSSTLFCYV